MRLLLFALSVGVVIYEINSRRRCPDKADAGSSNLLTAITQKPPLIDVNFYTI